MTLVLPDTEELLVLVAVTVIFPGEAGAVSKPLPSIVPPLADQFTGEPAPPWTIAVHWDVAFGSIAAGLQLTATLAALVSMGDWVPPPHPINAVGIRQANAANRKKGPCNLLFIPHRRRLEGAGTSITKRAHLQENSPAP
jgi:hypothetical protein